MSKVTPSVYLKVCNQLNTMGVISRIDENSSESDKKLAENHLESMKNDLGNSLDRNSTISDDKKDTSDTFEEIDVKDKIIKEPVKDKEADEFLDNLDDITPKQKMRFKVISRKYKDLELNGVKLNKILNQPHDIEIDTKEFGENVIGKDPVDDSIRNSKLNDFDKSFLKKTYDKQLVSILTSFRANGLYLTDLKVNKVQTPLNSDLIYTCKYTNVDNKQFQIKLKIPTVDAEGRIIVDGIHKVMKKQRIDLPIVKISDTEVSLSSNYNKYRVIKNTTKAHDYFTFIENMIDNGRANVNIIYGNNDLNLPISYDYVALARHWSEVSFNSPVTNLECNLIFKYSAKTFF